ncbi:manganese/zinc/iron transport system permease protein [Trueperella bonasi]|uniref:Manganese/zinc/iron transport system permease protein n=1 Tax=Trueperella bonasi TaxID=312286 RepID=A0ABT9NF02_9ACTO|nr:metal ABC transporter permease [Trueperella bonasi]MDP9805976.1 manganese/zinc/iron transport system permease protein [Trueperella bonasi]
MSFIVAAFLLSVTTAVTCAVPGVFVVLRRQSMLVDAISHGVLPGIVLGVALTGSLKSPLMIVGATLMGLLIVASANWLRNSNIVKGDADQGVIFPVLFAIGVLMLSTVFSDAHICADTVLAGDLNLMALPSEHLVIAGYNIGPRMMWILIAVLAINMGFIVRNWRILTVGTFDPEYAQVIGMPARRVSNILMFLVTLTIVTAFNVAGSILVIALMISPVACALLVARTMPGVIGVSVSVACASAVIGFWTAWKLNLPTSAAMAFFGGVIFMAFALWSVRADKRIAESA